MRARTLIGLLTAVALAAGTPSAGAAVVWPSSSGWQAIQKSGGNYTDPANDVSPASTDVVGDSTYAAGFWSYDATNGNLMFRVRLNAAPNNPQSVWQILLDTDTDSGVDWALQRDDSGGNQMELVPSTTEGPTFGSVVLSTSASWTGSLATYSRFVNPTGDSSNFSSNSDAFVDMAIPWSSFSTATGLSLTSSFRVGLSSSASHQGINKDFPLSLSSSSSVSAGWSDPIRAAPEPGSLVIVGLGLVMIAILLRRRRRHRSAPRA